MGHGCADGVGDEGPFDERAALLARGAEAALFAGEGEEEFVAASGALQARETGVKITAVEERLDGDGGFRVQAREFLRVVVEDLPDRRSAGLAGAVAGADHLG